MIFLFWHGICIELKNEFNERDIVMKRTAAKMMMVVMMTLMTITVMAQPPQGGRGMNGHSHGGRDRDRVEYRRDDRRKDNHRYDDRRHADRRHDEHRRECAPPEDLQRALQAIDNQSFDEKKLETAELCVSLGHFCTNDLAHMARKFKFDDTRRKFLTYAHPYVTDPQNYYDLRRVFEFKSNFEEMMEDIR